MKPRRIVLTTFGSFGDLHPYIAIALGLKARGYEAVLGTSPCYRRKVEALGLGFASVRPDSEFIQDPAAMRRFMHPRWGLSRVGSEVFLPALRDTYQDTVAAIHESDLLVTHPLAAHAGRLASEITGVPWVSTMITPLGFLSAYDMPILPFAPTVFRMLRALGPGACKPLVWIGKRASRPLARPWYRLRSEIGLPVATDANPLTDSHSSRAILALFSRHFITPQPDWPPNTTITGFPVFDQDETATLPPGLLRFLDDGPPPIIFTLGSSAAAVAGSFFEDSAAVAKALRRRAVLIVGRRWAQPTSLPQGVVAFDYAPFSQLFQRAAAIVHPGGIGSCGLSLQSGRPSLVVPHSMDHFDNAARLARLGVGRVLVRGHYNQARATVELGTLLEQTEYSERASTLGQRMRPEDGVQCACDTLTNLWRSS